VREGRREKLRKREEKRNNYEKKEHPYLIG
jgi:hypothetical protein